MALTCIERLGRRAVQTAERRGESRGVVIGERGAGHHDTWGA